MAEPDSWPKLPGDSATEPASSFRGVRYGSGHLSLFGPSRLRSGIRSMLAGGDKLHPAPISGRPWQRFASKRQIVRRTPRGSSLGKPGVMGSEPYVGLE